MSDEALRVELIERIAHDDAVREQLAATGALFDGYHPRMEAVHRDNVRWLAPIVEASGWPGRSRVGDEAASAAWRIVQHAIGEPPIVRALAPVIAAAVRDGEADPRELAMLEDRIRMFEGRPQRYGTQLDWNDDGTAMVPAGGVEAPDDVDARRAAIGLPPIVWRRSLPTEEPRPRDLAAHRRGGEAWARRVGWR